MQPSPVSTSFCTTRMRMGEPCSLIAAGYQPLLGSAV
jgi:hypothetical protein